MNRVILIGNVGQDLETRFTPNGNAVTNISLATSKQIKGKQVTEWHRIITWNKLAENCGKYLKKGSKIAVEGEITTRSWDDKDGKKKYSTEIVAHSIEFISGTVGGGGTHEGVEVSSDGTHIDMSTSDIPF